MTRVFEPFCKTCECNVIRLHEIVQSLEAFHVDHLHQRVAQIGLIPVMMMMMMMMLLLVMMMMLLMLMMMMQCRSADDRFWQLLQLEFKQRNPIVQQICKYIIQM